MKLKLIEGSLDEVAELCKDVNWIVGRDLIVNIEFCSKKPDPMPKLPPKGTPILIRDYEDCDWILRSSAGELDNDGYILCYPNGLSSGEVVPWKFWKYVDGGEK